MTTLTQCLFTQTEPAPKETTPENQSGADVFGDLSIFNFEGKFFFPSPHHWLIVNTASLTITGGPIEVDETKKTPILKKGGDVNKAKVVFEPRIPDRTVKCGSCRRSGYVYVREAATKLYVKLCKRCSKKSSF